MSKIQHHQYLSDVTTPGVAVTLSNDAFFTEDGEHCRVVHHVGADSYTIGYINGHAPLEITDGEEVVAYYPPAAFVSAVLIKGAAS